MWHDLMWKQAPWAVGGFAIAQAVASSREPAWVAFLCLSTFALIVLRMVGQNHRTLIRITCACCGQTALISCRPEETAETVRIFVPRTWMWAQGPAQTEVQVCCYACKIRVEQRS